MTPALTAGTAFIQEDVGGHAIRFRRSDSFGSLTDLCAIYDKLPAAFLRLPSTKRTIKALEKSENQMCENLTSTQTNGLYRGTYVHPILLVDAARWCDPGFHVACNKAVLKVLSAQGQYLAGGDVALPISTEALEKALVPTDPAGNALGWPHGAQAEIEKIRLESKQLTSIVRQVVLLFTGNCAMTDERLDRLEANRNVVVLPAPAPAPISKAAPAPRKTTRKALPEAPLPSGSSQAVRRIISRRMYDYTTANGIYPVGVVWNRLYARLKDLVGFDVNENRPKGYSGIAWVEANGGLSILLDLSEEFIVRPTLANQMV